MTHAPAVDPHACRRTVLRSSAWGTLAAAAALVGLFALRAGDVGLEPGLYWGVAGALAAPLLAGSAIAFRRLARLPRPG
jgi:predicted cobalt transporter CbtA